MTVRHFLGRIRRVLKLQSNPEAADRRALVETLVRGASWREVSELLVDSGDAAEQQIAAFADRMRDSGPEGRIVLHHHCLAGRVEHFHHYMGAILLPFLQLVDIGAIAAGDRLLVPDCGAMNPRIEEVAGSLGIETAFYPQPLAGALASVAGARHFHLPAYDKSHDSDFFLKPHQIARVRRVAFAFAGIEGGDRPALFDPAVVLLVDRAPPLDYYASSAYPHAPNREGLSGSARRSIPNMAELEELLARGKAVRRLFLETMPLREQIRAFNEATVVIGQHGAGLNGLLWARPGAAVIEIIPVSNLGHQFTYFSNIAEAMGLRHYHVVQAAPHDPVDCMLLERFVSAELTTARG